MTHLLKIWTKMLTMIWVQIYLHLVRENCTSNTPLMIHFRSISRIDKSHTSVPSLPRTPVSSKRQAHMRICCKWLPIILLFGRVVASVGFMHLLQARHSEEGSINRSEKTVELIAALSSKNRCKILICKGRFNR